HLPDLFGELRVGPAELPVHDRLAVRKHGGSALQHDQRRERIGPDVRVRLGRHIRAPYLYRSAAAYFSARPTSEVNSSKLIRDSASRALVPFAASSRNARSSARAAESSPVSG